HHLLRSESAGRNPLPVAAAIAFSASRNAVAEIRARHRALDSLGSARAVALSRTCRHVKAASLRRVQFRVRLAHTRQSVGIAKAARLYLLDRRIHRRLLRASPKISGMHQLRTRPARRLYLR